jgi:hypothetical protein
MISTKKRKQINGIARLAERQHRPNGQEARDRANVAYRAKDNDRSARGESEIPVEFVKNS